MQEPGLSDLISTHEVRTPRGGLQQQQPRGTLFQHQLHHRARESIMDDGSAKCISLNSTVYAMEIDTQYEILEIDQHNQHHKTT